MRLLFVLLFLLLATLSLAAIPSAAKNSSLSRKEHRKPFAKKVNGGTLSAIGRSSQAAKKLARNRKRALNRRLKKRVDATKSVTSAGAGKMSPAVSGSGKSSQGDSTVLGFFPKVLVELIGEYLEGSFSVVLERSWWSAAYMWWNRVTVDSERHYLITNQDVQASSHGGGEQVSLGSPDLSRYEDFQSSHDGCSLLFTGKSQEQVSISSSERTTRWLVQETGTKRLKSVTLEGGKSSLEGDIFMLSTNGKALLSTLYNSILDTWTTSVYQIKEHGTAASASKKGGFDGEACAVSGNGNRILTKCEKKKQLEVHDISGDRSSLVLKVSYAGIAFTCLFVLNNDGSKAAFTDDNGKLYIVDVGKQMSFISVKQLTPIDIPNPNLSYCLIYDANDRLYIFRSGSLWLLDPSERKLVSLEEAEVPQEYEIWSWDVSPNVGYIALLFQSKGKSEKGEHRYQMVVKRDTKDVLMRLCRC